MSRTLYIEPNAGIAGDIFSAALIGLLNDTEKFYDQIYSLPIKDEFKIEASTVLKSGINANKFSVIINEKHNHVHGRHLQEIVEIINNSKISDSAKKTAVNIFNNLAEAEAEIHGSTTKHVHFHEVGAIDAIVDICSISILIDLLNIDNIISSSVALGTGTIKSAHGVLPVPCPATSLLLKGFPVKYTGIQSELTTPTGAASLRTIVNSWNTTINGEIIKSEYGAGTREIKDIVNVLRVSIIEDTPNISGFESDEVAVIECNIDDFQGEHFSFLEESLFNAGALDYIIIPGTMKKTRPGMVLQIISPIGRKNDIIETILMNTSTIGVRYRTERRSKLNRKICNIDTPLGKVRVKMLYRNNDFIKFKAEQADIHDICKKYDKNYISTLHEINFYIQQWINNINR